MSDDERCACPVRDAAECMRRRSPRDPEDWFDEAYYDPAFDDYCECACHGTYDADYEEQDDG